VAGSTVAMPDDHLAFAVLEDGAGEQTQTLSGVVAGATLTITKGGRLGPLQYLVVEDARARPLAGALYATDLDAWTITLPSSFSADGYEAPFLARFLALVAPEAYEVNALDGEVTWADPLDLSGYTPPLKARWRKHDLSLIVEARTTGEILLQTPLGHDYTTAAAIATMLLHGDLGARVANQFVEHTAPAIWEDFQQGDPPTSGATYDWTAYPVGVTNAGAIRERWRLVRRSDTYWNIVGETLGIIGTWDGSAPLEAKRAVSQAHPYFILDHRGLGSAWATGNMIQFETFGTPGPLWVLRTVRPGAATVATDSIRLRHRVGAD
jgi:hypothetical protein